MMAYLIDFRTFVLQAARQTETAALLPVIEKELLHYEILLAMDKARLLERLTFQGGACLRLCYSSGRFSEDLDFVGGKDFGPDEMGNLRTILMDSLTHRYDVVVEAVEPKPLSKEVYSWQLEVITATKRPDLPQQRISIEVAAIEAHTRAVRPLAVNYPDLLLSYGNVLMVRETIEEICADKLKAFITASHMSYWDLWWLFLQPGFDKEQLPLLLQYELDDYGVAELFRHNLTRLEELDLIVNGSEFTDQMRCFLPQKVLAKTIERSIFREHLVEVIPDLYEVATRNS